MCRIQSGSDLTSCDVGVQQATSSHRQICKIEKEREKEEEKPGYLLCCASNVVMMFDVSFDCGYPMWLTVAARVTSNATIIKNQRNAVERNVRPLIRLAVTASDGPCAMATLTMGNGGRVAMLAGDFCVVDCFSLTESSGFWKV